MKTSTKIRSSTKNGKNIFIEVSHNMYVKMHCIFHSAFVWSVRENLHIDWSKPSECLFTYLASKLLTVSEKWVKNMLDDRCQLEIGNEYVQWKQPTRFLFTLSLVLCHGYLKFNHCANQYCNKPVIFTCSIINLHVKSAKFISAISNHTFQTVLNSN